ncbi:MAG: ribosome assembly RNA-binding protein YhbY [Candidatus Methanomethylicota archaeon]|uniref:Ribosome assembly RNA-binding protein YhbY n=1 Tax=Thermoproteota archaeon TaxID=2056631 RepID=A0A497F9T7_9CREN|nr:MAG: ribosome assembly RNA-binding protein YhbY [Candidatus Verstraetearchaeota archaeon]RLE55902.1 MAG: ribosome assembly RNA-binding protein YhbY [Candidatus Verstraetearchaeota archaeon]
MSSLSPKEKRRLADSVQQEAPHVHVGKRGLCSEVLDEIDRQLEAREVIKVRILKSALQVENCDRKTLAKKLAEAVGAEILDIRGLTAVLYRKRRLYKR